MWQDWVFAIGAILMGLSLVPVLFDKQKPKVITSMTNCLVLFFFAFTQESLGLHMYSVVSFITAAIWAVLAAQRTRNESSPDEVCEGKGQPEHS